MDRCRRSGRATPRILTRACALLAAAAAITSCAAHASSTDAAGTSSRRPLRVAVDLASVHPAPVGCSLASSCAPASARDMDLGLVPSGYRDTSGLRSQPEAGNGVMLTRIWRAPKPSFLDPGGEPMGAMVTVQVIRHPVEPADEALGLANNPRGTSKVAIAKRIAYESDWTIPTQDLQGRPVQISASSVYVVLSSRITVEVTTIGMTPSVAQALAKGVVVR
jgi:hypothetical protein